MHGTASATAAALMGMECTVYMGAVDVARQAPNVSRMKVLGAKVVAVKEGQATLKEAVDAALAAWIEDPEAFYLLGSVVGPSPYPEIVRTFQSVIGREARRQFLEREGRLPDEVAACVGGGSNAMGLFSGFLDDPEVLLTGVEPGGKGVEKGLGAHAATFARAREAWFTASGRWSCRMPRANRLPSIPSQRAWTIPAWVPSTPT
jgi:Tryptophan synthase beta chain